MRKTSIRTFVLDAWALLALIQGEEPAASKVLKRIDVAERKTVSLHMSWIIVGEVYYQVGRRKGEAAAEETLGEICCCPSGFMTSEDKMSSAPPKSR